MKNIIEIHDIFDKNAEQYSQYCEMILKAKNRKLPSDIYFEKHHIIPRCLGGSDNKCNLVKLTAYEHLKAHMILVDIMKTKQHRYKMLWAFNAMMVHQGDHQQRVTYNDITDNDLRHIAHLKEQYRKLNGINCKIIDPLGDVYEAYSIAELGRKVGDKIHVKHVKRIINGKINEYKGWRSYHRDYIGIPSNYDPLPIKLVDPNGVLHSFSSYMDAHNSIDIPYNSIRALCLDEIKQSHVKGWRRFDNNEGIEYNYETPIYKFIDPSGNIVETYNMTSLAKQYGILQSMLSAVHTGREKSYKGWIKYVEGE